MSKLFAVAAGVLTTIAMAIEAGAGTTVQAVTRRGELVCGVAHDLPGFSAPDSRGQSSYRGILGYAPRRMGQCQARPSVMLSRRS